MRLSLHEEFSDTEAYTLFDHVFSKTIRSLSAVIGLRRVTQPFWNRWLASGIESEVIFEFLDSVGSIDNWASVAERVANAREAAFLTRQPELAREEEIAGLRRLSYLFYMAQWGGLPLTDQRRALYRKARDYYIAAETLAFGDSFRRLKIDWPEIGAIPPGIVRVTIRSGPL